VAPEYAFLTRWRVRATAEEVAEILGDAASLARFEANHRWAMARGEESLELELRRRRAGTAAERDSVPAPPGPTFRPR